MTFWSITPSGTGTDYTVEADTKEEAFAILARRIQDTGDVMTPQDVDEFRYELVREGYSRREAQEIIDDILLLVDDGLYLRVMDIKVSRISRRGHRGGNDPESLGWDLAIFLSKADRQDFWSRYADLGEAVDDCIEMMGSPSYRKYIVEDLYRLVSRGRLSSELSRDGTKLIERIEGTPASMSRRPTVKRGSSANKPRASTRGKSKGARR